MASDILYTGAGEKEPTCTEAGKVVYSAVFDAVEDLTFNPPTEEEILDATNHDYEAKYEWNGYTECIATFTCKNDAS